MEHTNNHGVETATGGHREIYDNPAKLAEAILETVATCHAIHKRYEVALRKAKVAECDYKLQRAQAYLRAEGTQSAREAARDVEVDTIHRLFQIADAEAGAMRERILTLRAELTALQSLLGALRAEYYMAGTAQRYDT